jgi:Na+-translocating ferredoxin:NAD+ oxidoreductase RnfG subunit
VAPFFIYFYFSVKIQKWKDKKTGGGVDALSGATKTSSVWLGHEKRSGAS